MTTKSSERTLAMTVANTGFLVDRLGQDCAPLQFLRELTQNSIEAILHLPGDEPGQIIWDVDEEQRILNGKRCLCVIDTGVGMSKDEQFKYINKLSSSISEQTIHKNFGIGAKIAGVTKNHAGLLYLSWKDSAGSMLHLWRDPTSGQYGLRQHELPGDRFEHVVEISDDVKPKLVKTHGTKVVLLGNGDQDETILPPPGVRAPTKWIRRYLNTRYYQFPERVTLKVREGWDLPKEDQNYTLREVNGQKHFLSQYSIASGRVPLSSADAHWWILEDKKDLVQNFSHFAASGHMAALYQDELYEMTEGRASAAKLQQFGVVFGYARVVIYIQPHTGDGTVISANTARTALLFNSDPLPWAEWAAEFRSRMPVEIDQLMADVAAGISSVSHKESIMDRIKKILDLYRVSRYRRNPQGVVTADEFVTPGGEPKPTDVTRTDRGKTGGAGGRAGDVYALFIKPEGDAAEAVVTDNAPEVVWVSLMDGTRERGVLEDRAAKYIPEKNQVQANADFRVFTDMIDRYVKQYGDIPGLRSTVKDVVHEWFEQTLIETILGVLAIKESPEWNLDTIASAWSEEALTAAVMPRYHIDVAIRRTLGSKLGGLRDKAEQDLVVIETA